MSDDAVFELERFSAAPVSGDVAVVEVDGRFARGALNGNPPWLLVETAAGDRIELPALAPVSGPQGRWHASFAVPADGIAGSSFALAMRDLLLDLPAPDSSAADGDRLVALARELNVLRRALREAEDAVVAAEAERDAVKEGVEGDSERVRSEAEAAKDRALSESAALMETALREQAERHAAQLAEVGRKHEAALAEAVGGSKAEAETASRAVADADAALVSERERAEGAEAERDELDEELRELRRTLKAARADAEALRRERDGLTRELERAQKVIPRGRVTASEAEPAPEPAGPVDEAELEEDDDATESPTRIARSDQHPTTVAAADEVEAGEPVERVRVIGRQGPRRATETLPPPDASIPPTPPIVTYVVAAIIFVLAVIVVTLLVL